MTVTDKTTFFIVVYKDDDCIYLPMTWNKNCEGALCCGDENDEIAAFATRAEVKKAIEISKRFYALCRAQGKPADADFDKDNLGKIKIVRCVVDLAKKAGAK